MKRRFPILTLFLVLAFGAGYAVRIVEKGEAFSSSGNVDARGRGDGSSHGSDGPNSHRTVDRSQLPNAALKMPHPFAPGHAREWLDALSHINLYHDLERFRLVRQCSRMDVRDAAEMGGECLRMTRQQEESDDTAKSESTSVLSEEVVLRTFIRWSELDPVAALNALREAPDLAISRNAECAVLASLVERDPGLAMDQLAKLPEANQFDAVAAMMPALVERDPRGALALLEKSPDNAILTREFLGEAALSDPALALDVATRQAIDSHDPEVMGQLLALGGDLQGKIVEWASAYDGPESEKIRGGVLTMMAHLDPLKAVELYPKMSAGLPEKQLEECTTGIATGLNGIFTVEAFGKADAFAAALPAGPLRDGAFAALADAWIMNARPSSATDPSIIESNIDDMLVGLPFQPQSDKAIIDDKSLAFPPLDPASPAKIYRGPQDWIREMSPSPERDELTLSLIETLQEKGPEQALPWVDSLPDGERKDILRRETELKIELGALKQRKRHLDDGSEENH